MKRIAAFLTAVVMLIVFATGLHFYGLKEINTKTYQIGTWNNPYKYASHDTVAANLTEDTILTFGSSEFNHGVKTPFHPKAIFKDQKMTPMIMGSAYSQSMTHTIALAALEPDSKQRKAVLLLSPQWFNEKGVKPEAFAMRFSESDYVAMMQNKNMSFELKESIANRTIKLLEKDETMQGRVKRYNKVYLYKNGNFIDKIFSKVRQGFVREKDRLCVLTAMKTSKIKKGATKKISGQAPNWTELSKKADRYAKKRSTNQFFMSDSVYNKKIKRVMKKRKGIDRGRSYANSPEFDDLKMFLDVCKERNIEPLVIMLPLNGYWYDYTGFPKQGREDFYKETTSITNEYGVKAIDYSKYEYTPFFMQDGVHFSSKGWVKINEEIYNFYKKSN